MKNKLPVILLIILFLASCTQAEVDDLDETSPVIIEERVEGLGSSDYQIINEMTDIEEIKLMNDLLDRVHWEVNTEVTMDREPDYKVNDSYHIWVTPHGDRLEIVHRESSLFGVLREEESTVLLELMTGREL